MQVQRVSQRVWVGGSSFEAFQYCSNIIIYFTNLMTRLFQCGIAPLKMMLLHNFGILKENPEQEAYDGTKIWDLQNATPHVKCH